MINNAYGGIVRDRQDKLRYHVRDVSVYVTKFQDNLVVWQCECA